MCFFYFLCEVIFNILKKINPKNTFGIIVRAGQKTVYYSNPLKLKADLVAFYGVW